MFGFVVDSLCKTFIIQFSNFVIGHRKYKSGLRMIFFIFLLSANTLESIPYDLLKFLLIIFLTKVANTF